MRQRPGRGLHRGRRARLAPGWLSEESVATSVPIFLLTLRLARSRRRDEVSPALEEVAHSLLLLRSIVGRFDAALCSDVRQCLVDERAIIGVQIVEDRREARPPAMGDVPA